MPTQINVMFDNFNIQTWKTFLVSFKMYTWFIERKKTIQNKQTLIRDLIWTGGVIFSIYGYCKIVKASDTIALTRDSILQKS
jgi:hypothetical protein